MVEPHFILASVPAAFVAWLTLLYVGPYRLTLNLAATFGFALFAAYILGAFMHPMVGIVAGAFGFIALPQVAVAAAE